MSKYHLAVALCIILPIVGLGLVGWRNSPLPSINTYLVDVDHSPSPSDAASLIGMWEQTDNTGRSLGEIYTLEFRGDGSFVERKNGSLIIYGYQDIPSSTTTGHWSVVSDPASEMVIDPNNPTKPPKHLPPTKGVLLKWYVSSYPWYTDAFLERENGFVTLELKPLIGGFGQQKYKRLE